MAPDRSADARLAGLCGSSEVIGEATVPHPQGVGMNQESFEDSSLTEESNPASSCYPGRKISRRSMLRKTGGLAGTGLASAVLGGAAHPAGMLAEAGKASVGPNLGRGGRTPITLMIDDGGPVDAMYYMHPGYDTPLVPPIDFCEQVASTLEKFEICGKMTILPMPSCLGRIDQSVKNVPQAHLDSFLQIVRTRIAPRFNITPEFLTHLFSFNLSSAGSKLNQSGGYTHFFEDNWITQARPEEIVAYFSLAYTILKNVGIESPGMTSPWQAGIDVENKYAQAVSDAQWNTLGRATTWYFLHDAEWGPPQPLVLSYQSPSRHRAVVSIPGNFPDLFWSMDTARDQRAKFIQNNIDKVLSPDGRTGRLRDLMESGYPLTLVTHWQSLWTQGTRLGLEGLVALLTRIHEGAGGSLEWVTCAEMVNRYLVASRTAA
jgi:hypothetical protein